MAMALGSCCACLSPLVEQSGDNSFSLQGPRKSTPVHFQQSKRWCGKARAADSKEPETSSASTPTPPTRPTPPTKPTFTMSKGQIVRVDKELYLASVEYLAVGHPVYFKGLDYIYEDRGEILDLKFFTAGEYALIQWAGIPTSPAWLPVYMLIKSEKMSYKRT